VTRDRGSVLSAVAAAVTAVGGLTVLSTALTTPIAHADTVFDILNTIDKDRARTGCPIQTGNRVLTQIAEAVTFGASTKGLNYKGEKQVAIGKGDPVAAALTNAYGPGGAGALLGDCRFTEVGVAFYRDTAKEVDTVTIAFGIPAPAPPVAPPRVLTPIPAQGPSPFGSPVATPPPAVPPVAAALPTATVIGDVDLYSAPTGDDKDRTGTFLKKGAVVKVLKPCTSNDWCALADGTFAFGEFLNNN
jgi:hypothetical protein